MNSPARTSASGWTAYLPALRRALARFALVGLLPILAFYVAFRTLGPVPGIIAGTLTASAALTIQAFRLRRFDPIGVIPIGTVLIQGAAGLIFQSVDVYLAAPAFENALWGLFLIGSVVVGRPFIGLAARELQLMPEAAHSAPAVQQALGTVTLMWGLAAFVKAAIRLALLAALPLELFLLSNSVLITILNLGLLAFSGWYCTRAARTAPKTELDTAPRGSA